MKAGLVTFYHIHHYGALLQAAATERAVESLGWDCEIVDYYVNQDNALFRRPTGLGSAAHDAHTALHYGALSERYRRFEQFSRERLHISARHYRSWDELAAGALPYDVLLSGSDQIWNPKIFPDGRFDPVFFATFSQKRRIAYAPSFGIPVIPEGMQTELKGYLEGFSHLSARERQGCAIIADTAGREAAEVLDPTLLLTAEQWAAMANHPADYPAGGYILCYCISAPGALTPYVERLAAETGLPVVQLCGIRRRVHPKARQILDAGPAEFLSLFRNAAYVVTNSFHGTVFSVQFHRPFFTTVSPAELAAPERSRTASILGRLGLTDRVIGTGSTAALDASIDWERVEAALTAARGASFAYLSAALENRLYAPEKQTEQGAASVPRLADRSHCTGCTACAAGCPKNAIRMVRDRTGFDFPEVDLNQCVHCGRCTSICPLLHERGPAHLPAAFAAWNRDAAVRRDSTSGGAFTAIADYVLEGGGVVFGAALDGQQHLRHVACFRKEDLWRLRGAKYA